MKLIVAIVRPFKVAEIVDAVTADPTFPGITFLESRGFGREKSLPSAPDARADLTDFVAGTVILVAAPEERAPAIAARLEELARTGRPGDGKVFTVPLKAAVRISTGAHGNQALE